MCTAMASVLVLGLALGLSGAALADQHDEEHSDEDVGELDQEVEGADRQRFLDAGLPNAHVHRTGGVARFTHDGETFYVVGGLNWQAGQQEADAAAEADAAVVDDEQDLERQLDNAGIADYEIIRGVTIAEVQPGYPGGPPIYVIYGLENE